MFSRKLCFALLSLSLSSLMAQAAPALPFQRPNQDCSAQPVSTVIKTVTLTASANTGAPTLNNGSNGSANQGNGNQANTNQGKGNQSNTNTGKGGQNNGNGNGGGKGNTGNANASASVSATSSAASATSTAVKGGNGAASGNAGNSTANTGGNANNSDPQKSTTLDPKVIASGFANDGQDVPTAGQVSSLTSTNNFINFCLTVPNLPITNGKQITTGSCNPAPIGTIPSVDNMPSSKFVFPKNFDTVKANTAFTIQMAIKNLDTGFFVNAQSNYFSAPQQLNAQGQIIGHSHVVVETLSAIDQTTPTDPKKFAFFKGLNAAAVGGVLTADVTAGLPVGFYKLSSINSAANHQPAIAAVAQHGSLDDAIYFSVTADGVAAAGSANAGAGAGAGAAVSSSAAASATSAPVVKGNAAPVASAEATSTAAAGTKGGKGANAGNANAGKGAQAASSAAAAATTAAGGKGGAAGNVKGAQVTSSAAAAAATSSAAGGKGAAAAQAGNVKSNAATQQQQGASSNPNVKGQAAPVAGGA